MSFRRKILSILLSAAPLGAQTAPPPAIRTLNPSSAIAGGSGFTLTATGANLFQCDAAPCLTINWSGPSGTATLSATGDPNGSSATATVPANLISAPGNASVSVTALFGTSNSLTFTINYPTPAIATLSPAQAQVGGNAFTLTVTGSGFISASMIQVNGVSQPTSFVNSQTLTTTIGSAFLAAPGQLLIDVIQPNGASSPAVFLPVSYPVPTISSLNPSQVAATNTAVSVTINGTGFYAVSTVQINGTTAPSSFVNAQQLTATVPASALAAAPGTVAVTVTNPGPVVSSPATLVVAAPTISSLSPSSAAASGAAFTLTVNGTNFIAASMVTWNGTALTTSFVNGGQLTAAVGAALIGTAGSASVRVQNTAQAISAPATFLITARPLTITSLNPSSATAGSSDLTLTVNGTGFVSGAQVSWKGSALTTTFGSATQLTAVVPASLLAQPGSATVLVTNPDQSQSNTATFTINAAPPTIIALSPSSATAGGPAFTLTVTGTGFLSGAAVQWGTTSLTTTFGSATQLTAAVPAALIAQVGSASVVVIDPNKLQSNAVNFAVVAVTPPVITSLSPASKDAGGAAFTLTVNGTGFGSGATVNWNGSALPTTFGSASLLTAAVDASLITNPGSATVTVINPDGTTSGAAAAFAITVPAPPSVTFSGPPTIGATQQPTLTFSMGGAYPLAITGQVVLSFTPDAVNPADDPAIQFASGGRTLTFSVPANSTQVPAIAIQTGTVSGTIRAQMTLQSGGSTIPVSDVVIQIARAAPVIRSVTVTRSTGTLQLTIVGYATPREVTQAVFHFNPAAGASQIPDVTVNASTLFGPWFQSTASSAYGSQFTYTQTFNVQGDASQIGTIAVTLSDSAGASQSATSN